MASHSSRCARVAPQPALLFYIIVAVVLSVVNAAVWADPVADAANAKGVNQLGPDQLSALPVADLWNALALKRANNNVWMAAQQQMLLESYLNPNFTMLEYGSGFSTMWYSQFVNRYYSIEHNTQWGRSVTEMTANNSKISYHVVAAKPRTPEFRKYIEKPAEFGVEHFDAVLIDGRNRVDCAKFILQYITRASVVFLHDYFERPWYYTVEKYYDVVAAAKHGRSLVVLRKKYKLPPVVNDPPHAGPKQTDISIRLKSTAGRDLFEEP